MMNNKTESSDLISWSIEFNFWKIIIIFISVLICSLTAGGNVLVLLSFKINKKLRTTNNYFLVSLAIADLIIGFVSMPISTIYFITEKWLLGPYICDIWLSLDYTVSNASVANLLLISFDRYFSITRPLTYRVNRTTKKVTCLIAFSWFISALTWTPFIIGWPYIIGKRLLKDDECQVQFLYTNKYLTLSTCIAAFYLPVIVICIIYYKIWQKTKKRRIELRNLQAETNSKNSKGSIKSTNIKINENNRSNSSNNINNSNNNYNNNNNSNNNNNNNNNTTNNNNNNNSAKGKNISINKMDQKGWNSVRKKLTEIKKMQKNFIDNLVDKEEDEDVDLNDLSTMSCEISHQNSSFDWRQSKKQKTSFETIETGVNPEFHQRQLSPKWYFRIRNSKKLRWFYQLFNRLSFCKRNTSSSKLNTKSIDYSKCKLYYRSNKTLNNNNRDSTKLNCKYCQNERDYSFYTIVIELKKTLDKNANENEKLNWDRVEKQPFVDKKVIIRQYPSYSLKSASSENLTLNKKRINFENYQYLNNPLNSIKKSKSTNKLNEPISMIDTEKSSSNILDKQYDKEKKESIFKNKILDLKTKHCQRKKLEKKQDQKAAKTLSAILFAFIFTWTPYNINVVMNTFCDNCLGNFEIWQSFAYWLCYMNSTINPVLYALCNASFRRTFKDIFAKFKFKK